MISGAQALGSIERTISAEQAAVREIEAHLEALHEEEESLREANLEGFRELARLRLDEIASGKVVGRLDSAEKEALALLSQRNSARREIETQLAETERDLEAQKDRRTARENAVAAAEARVEEAEETTRARLERDADYASQAERAQKLDIQAANAEDKADQSAEELGGKRAAYEADLLFMYLWRRGYGTSAYSAFPLIRALDGWVAGMVGYAEARTNYYRLLEIPRRLREHADRLSGEAEAEEARLDGLWQEARLADGIGALDATLSEKTADLAETEGRIDDLLSRQAEVLDQLRRFAKGEDENSVAAIEILVRTFRDMELMALFKDARETLRPEDDRLVSQILERERNLQQLAATRSDVAQTLDRRIRRLEGLVSVAREFKQRRYAQSNSAFRDGALIGMVLKDFLEGALSRDALWDNLAREQRWRRTGTAGGRSHSRSGGRTLGGRVSRRSSVSRSGGRRSGGGFRTGGGF